MNKENTDKTAPQQITTEILHKEIDLIQDIIKRMANNSFLVKGWMITLFTAVMVLLKEELVTETILVVSPFIIFAVIAFWYVDAFYLHKERCYRGLYNHIISNADVNSRTLYSLDYTPFSKGKGAVKQMMMNSTIWPFYLIPILLNIAAILYVII